LQPAIVNDEIDRIIIEKKVVLTITVWSQDNAYEDIAERIIQLLHQYKNEEGFRIVFDREQSKLYDSETNAYGISMAFFVFSRTESQIMSLLLDHGDLQGLDDDDHLQYHNDARANTWFATKSIADLGTKDHDLLDGLLDDDHTQYLLINGTRAMTGALQLDDNNISGINNILFTDVNGQIAGIENQNLLDKIVDETITGEWTFSGHNAFGATGTVSTDNIITVAETFSGDTSGTLIGQNIAMIANPGAGSSAFYKSLYSYVFTTGAVNSTTGNLWGYQGFAGNSCGGGISVGQLFGVDGYGLIGLLFSETNNTATDIYGVRGTADTHSSNTGTVANNVYGIYGWGKQRGKGTVTNLYGLYGLSQIGDASGNVTNAYAIRAVYDHVSGTTINAYGLYIDSVSGATNNYGLVLAGNGVGSDIALGAGQNAKIYFTGFHLIIDSQVVGSGDVLFPHDNQSLRFGGGAGGDAEIYYDGADFVINPQLIGSGGVKILNMKSGATQVAAGAAADELWKTNGHATLPDNVIMIGV
jgi:hypothetical protein